MAFHVSVLVLLVTLSVNLLCNTPLFASTFSVIINREFTKPRRQRQRERHRTKDLMSKTMAVHVRYNSSLVPFFADLCKSTENDRILRGLESVNQDG